MTLRPATTADDEVVAHIAALGDAHTPPHYLAYVRTAGRLLVAEDHGRVVGFGGVVPVPDAEGSTAMVTDLFVHPEARGRGVGTQLLGELLAGNPRRMTCSSSHPAALPAYVRAGMEPRGTVHYWRGSAFGGAAPAMPEPWAHDRVDLVGSWAEHGAIVRADSVVERRGATVAVVQRVVSETPEREVEQLLRGLPADVEVTLCVPDWQPLGRWLSEHGFTSFDHDLWCATPDVMPDPMLAVVNPGLW